MLKTIVKKKRKEKKSVRQNPRTNGKNKAIQTESHKEVEVIKKRTNGNFKTENFNN